MARDAGQGTPAGKGHPSPEHVRAQLTRIVASPDFDVPERSRDFLRYVVEETLAGRGERIKGYTVAVEVFGRDAAFDAHADPVVRIEAGRLRRALERYYHLAGHADPVLIDIPKGGYSPVFAHRLLATPIPASDLPDPMPTMPPMLGGRGQAAVVLSAAGVGAALLLGVGYWTFARSPPAAEPEVAADAAPDEPTLMVVPFDGLGDEPAAKLYATGLTEEILTQLAPFRELTVLGREGRYDGKALTIVPQGGGAYARVDVPGTVDAMLDLIQADYQVNVPVADLLYDDLYGRIKDHLLSGVYLGERTVGGEVLDHLSFETTGVDWQLWLERGDRPPPRRLVVTFVTAPGQPEYLTVIKEWKLDPALEREMFSFDPPADWRRIEIPKVPPVANR